MPERGYSPEAVAAGFGPLSEREMSLAVESDRPEQESWYARMLDRYHDMYAFENKIKGKNRVVSDDEFKGINAGRNQLHQQLERLGRSLGKSKDMVLADVLAREGNLGEYFLPEYGILTYGQVDFDLNDLGGNSYHDVRRGRFVHANSSASALEQRRRMDKWRQENGILSETGEIDSSLAISEGVPEEREFSSELLPGEAVIIFGTVFTVDIQRDPVEIVPPGYPERVRRAKRAAEALKARGVGARPFMHTVGAYHDTVTVVGIAVPVDKIPVDTVELLRGHRSEFGVRADDMDPGAVEAEYQAARERTRGEAPVGYFDFSRAVLERIPKRMVPKARAFLGDENVYPLPLDEMASAFRDTFSELDSKVIDEARTAARAAHAERAQEFRRQFLEVHDQFFGKR